MNLETLMPHARPHEREEAARLIDTLLARPGAKVSVLDGDEWTVRGSTDRAAILGALCTTEADLVRWREADGTAIGSFRLVWGNGPGELVADCSDNPASLAAAGLS